jgi:basic membrane protein A and related proteins
MVSQTGVIAGIYGPAGALDRSNRTGFERGARYARPGVRVLGAFQPADAGAPYANPTWGAAEAQLFLNQNADVISGAGGTTGVGALRATARAGKLCIAADLAAAADPAVAPCLLSSTAKFIDLGVKQEVADSAAGRWSGGVRDLGLAEHAVGLSPLTNPRLTPEIRGRLQTISDLLASGALATGV